MSQENEALASQEERAQYELFVKMAEAQNIDLDALQDEQVEEMYRYVFGEEEKTASEGQETEPTEEQIAQLAAEEFAATQEKVAEAEWADQMGRRMAHAYSDELDKIAGVAGALKTLASKGVDGAARAVGKGRQMFPGGKGNPQAIVPAGGRKLSLSRGGAAALGAGAGAAGGAAVAGRKKEASAIDELALIEAVKMAAAEGYDAEEAQTRVHAVHVLGGPEETKIASAQSVEEAVGIRALEYLAAAQYPVNWETAQA